MNNTRNMYFIFFVGSKQGTTVVNSSAAPEFADLKGRYVLSVLSKAIYDDEFASLIY